MKRSISIAVAASMLLGAAAVPTFASAQSRYDNYGRYDTRYDPCTREARERQTRGAVLGAVLGAAAGSSVASRGAKTEGGVLGAVLGAAVGANAGRSSAACGTYDNRYGYDNSGYNNGYGYSDRPYYGYDDRRYDRDYGYDDYGYGNDGYGYRPVSGTDTDGCRMAESTVRLPDGRTERRLVRTCPDSRGVYRIVD